jgi:hypothetical protein
LSILTSVYICGILTSIDTRATGLVGLAWKERNMYGLTAGVWPNPESPFADRDRFQRIALADARIATDYRAYGTSTHRAGLVARIREVLHLDSPAECAACA